MSQAIAIRGASTLASVDKAFVFLEQADREMRNTRTFATAIKAKSTAKVAKEIAAVALRDAAKATRQNGGQLRIKAAGLEARAEKLFAELDRPIREARSKGRPKKGSPEVTFLPAVQKAAESKRAPLADLPDEDMDSYIHACERQGRQASKKEAVALAKMDDADRAKTLVRLGDGDIGSVKEALHEKAKAAAAVAVQSAPERAFVRIQSATKFLESVDLASVDLLLTDPPYSTDVDDIEAFAGEWVPLALSRLKRRNPKGGELFLCSEWKAMADAGCRVRSVDRSIEVAAE